MSASQRTKGARFERAVAVALRDALHGVMVQRHGEAQRDGRGDVPDVQARGVVSVECKHHEKYANVIRELETAAQRTGPGEWPAGVVKADRKPAVVAMYFEDWLELLGAWHVATRATVGDALAAIGGTVERVD